MGKDYFIEKLNYRKTEWGKIILLKDKIIKRPSQEGLFH